MAEEKLCNEKKIETYKNGLNRFNLPIIYSFNHLSVLLNVDSLRLKLLLKEKYNHYQEQKIKKRDGSLRSLDCPSWEMKIYQKWVLNNILYSMEISKHAMGFTKGKSILHNAISHLQGEFIFNIDLEDFFPSIGIGRVRDIFYYYGYTEEVSDALAQLTTYKSKLPQGSPASPTISNLVCFKMDKRIGALCASYNYVYTRYADDISISGNKFNNNFCKMLYEIVESENFKINHGKTSLRKGNQVKFVTGLRIVNGRVQVKKEFLKKIKLDLHYMELYGVKGHLTATNINKSFYREHMYGKVFFIKMIDRELGVNLLERLDNLDWLY